MRNKKIIIIGASSGIGRALAEILVSEGNIVGITGRRTELLQDLEAAQPDRYYVRAFDVTDTDGCADHLDALVSTMGGVDILVISAGGGDVNEALDFAVEQKIIALNVSGFTCVADWAFNHFKAKGHGHLAAISSIAGIRGSRQAPAYSATKAYQTNYLQGLRQKAHKEQAAITITDIRPGFVDTPMAKSPVKFWVAPIDKAARQIYQALRKRKKVVHITKRWQLIAWIYKWLPGRLHERI
ncbi:SDR family NAD(P)-dependent oxidoreductase [Parapedobacter tibetensis]|uniref:SDR family NAD(P)-dependent oxidoreductase n=1 Tax=Parapedobacter tibetensis TaxID=2972951 RepID=UPI00214D6121|nr:SDR family NAD(P)-dependent oxidoreductase [Parapedobacter tibetensis]